MLFRINIIFLIVSFQSLGQISGDSLFSIAENQVNDHKIDSAFKIYKIIVEKHKTDLIYPRALYNLGWSAMILKKYDIGEKVSLEILASNFDDYEKGPGSGIMSEPYALYKHRACKTLSFINLNRADYETALKYERLADRKFPYSHFCGNELAESEISRTINYSKCYIGLKDKKKAIQLLLDKSFDSRFADNSEIIKLLDSLLTADYGGNLVVTELLRSEKTLKVKSGKNPKYVVKLFGSKLVINSALNDIDTYLLLRLDKMNVTYDEMKNLDIRKKALLYYKNTELYKALST